MAGKKDNIKALFTNTRSRVIIVFTAILLLIAVVVGISHFLRSTGKSGLSSDVPNSPSIQSIPGALDPTVQYAKLQETQNLTQAQKALSTGGSAIPTIIRSQTLGSGVDSVGGIGAKNGNNGLGFSALAREDEAGLQKNAWIQELQNSSCSKSAVNKVVAEGATLADLKGACSCIQLKDNGYQATNLQKVCSCKELKAAGYNAHQLKELGFSAERLRLCGFDACELRGAGFSAQEMKDGGFSDGELKGAGFSPAEIAKASGLPDGITEADVRNAGCQTAVLASLKARGVSASAIRRISGCSATQLIAAGFSAKDLKDAGFTAADLKKAGLSLGQLAKAGFTARELLNAGFTPKELADVGFSPEDIQSAESELPPGITANDIKKAGCDVVALKNERLAGVSAKSIRQYAGCSAAALKAAGFTGTDLTNAGFTAKELLNAGFTPAELVGIGFSPKDIQSAESELPPGITPNDIKKAGCDVAALKNERLAGVSAKAIRQHAGCSAAALKAAGFTDTDLTNAGFTPQQISAAQVELDNAIKAAGCDPVKLKPLFAQGASAERIHALNGCSASQLKEAGFDAKSLLDAGFTPADLALAGFSPADIKAAEATSMTAIRAAGCNPEKLAKLREAGVSARDIHEFNGCSVGQLKAAGFDAKALLAAGFTPQELITGGFTPQELIRANASPAAFIAGGRNGDCSQASLTAAKAAGVSATTIKQTLGCSASALKAAGFSAAELKAAGFTAAELKNAGFSATDLKAAGFSAKELKDAGFTAQQLKNAGFSISQLKDAGFSAADLKAAGFTAAQLKEAGFSAKELKDAGFSAKELKDAGFSAEELKDAGFSANDLRAAGFNASDLKAAGFSASDLKSAGFSPALLRDAGFSNDELKKAGFTASELGVANDTAVTGLNSQLNPLANTSITGYQAKMNQANAAEQANAKQIQDIMKRQNQQLADQKYQQKIQQRVGDMSSAASQSLQAWKKVSTQVYVQGTPPKIAAGSAQMVNENGEVVAVAPKDDGMRADNRNVLIKTGDILFAVIDTSINSDEPGPILATVVSGKFKGAKLIGSFNLPSNASKMVISFNTMSVPGAAKSTSISAYAVDADTARTALSSSTNHHYFLRYGSLFASSFLEGFGNAFQSANTTVTVGGVNGGNDITVQNGIGRSALENAVIGLATVGKSWGQVAQQQFNTPVTVEVFSGTGVGILFTRDLITL